MVTAVWEFVLNLKSRRLHLKRDGRDFPQCNLDQITRKSTFPVPPDPPYILCKRCGSAPDAPIG